MKRLLIAWVLSVVGIVYLVTYHSTWYCLLAVPHLLGFSWLWSLLEGRQGNYNTTGEGKRCQAE